MSKAPRSKPVGPHPPLPSQFPVIPPAPYGDHGYVASLDRSGTCRSCGKEGWINRHPGRFPHCGHCGAIQLYMGKFYDAPCVTFNGRTDGHMSYVSHANTDLRTADGLIVSECAFCGRRDCDPLPEWPEIDAEDLIIETDSWVERFHWVRITHKHHPEIVVFVNEEVSLLKNRAIALKQVREALKRVGRGAYNPEE